MPDPDHIAKDRTATARVATTRVAIVGAGLAGLSCAQALIKAGLQPVVFEKSRGTGGRMSTRRQSGDAGGQCDHGAQYFTASHPDFIAQCQRWLNAGVIAPWRPRIRVYGRHESGQLESNNNAPPERYVGVPGMTAPARHLAEGMTIHINTLVTKVCRSAQGWYLRTAESESGPFDWLVLAMPAQQAQSLLSTCPQQAALLAECRQFMLDPCWAMMVRLGKALEVDFDAAFVNPEPLLDERPVLSWMARDSSKPGRPPGHTWLLHASRPWSAEHLEADHSIVANAMLGAWSSVLGLQPQVEDWQLHRWRFAQVDNTAPGPGYLIDRHTRTGLCGDWLHRGRVEGAWLSGQQLAHELLLMG